MKSQRKITQMKFSSMDCISKFSISRTFDALNSIATHFGAEVRKFELNYCTMSGDQLVQILNLLPKLSILRLLWLNFNFKNDQSCNKPLTLPVLKELHLVGCNWAVEEIFTANQFEKKNLKNLKLTQHFGSDCSALLQFNHLALDKLMVLGLCNMDYILTTIKIQSMITVLDISKTNEAIFNEIIELKNLKVLTLTFGVFIEKFSQITRLEMLETLQFDTSMQLYIKKFSKLRMKNLKHLKIHLTTHEDCELGDELILIASNNLSLLSVDINCGFIPQNVTLMFLTNCKSLEVLDLHYTSIKNLPETLKCPNMKEFMFKNCLTIEKSLLPQLIRSFPNLEKIFMKLESSTTNQCIVDIFQGFPYLKSSVICDCPLLTEEVLDIIRNHKSLKVLTLCGFKVKHGVIKKAFKNHPRRLKFNSIKLPVS